MNNFGESIPVAITSRALTHNFSNEEKDRRTAALTNKDFYYDKGDKYINPVTPDVDISVVNLVRVITKKRTSLLYSQPLVREYEGPNASINFIEDFYNYIQIDKFLYSTDIMAELTGTGLVHISNDDNEYGIKLMLFDGSDVSVLANQNDPNIADAVSVIRMFDKLIEKNGSMQVERVLEQQIWTNNTVSVYTNNSTGSKPILEKTESHELPILPFVPFKGEDVEGQYLGHSSATNWRKLNDTYNKLLTHLGFMVKMESATPIALEGFESGEGLLIHPGRAINLPIGAKAEVLDFNPKIKETLETVQYMEDMIYNTSSVPKVTILGGNASSGRELMIQWFPLLQLYKDKAVRYKRYELNLANAILELVGLPPLEDMVIHFPEQSVLPLSTEEDNLERDIKLNLKTAIDELMRRQPELSEAEAEAAVRANQQFNQDIIQQSQEDNDGRERR
jgi:hypothetical protein